MLCREPACERREVAVWSAASPRPEIAAVAGGTGAGKRGNTSAEWGVSSSGVCSVSLNSETVSQTLSTRVLHLDTLITEHQINSEEKRVESEREMSQVTLLEPLVKLFFLEKVTKKFSWIKKTDAKDSLVSSLRPGCSGKFYYKGLLCLFLCNKNVTRRNISLKRLI